MPQTWDWRGKQLWSPREVQQQTDASSASASMLILCKLSLHLCTRAGKRPLSGILSPPAASSLESLADPGFREPCKGGRS